MSGSSHFDVIIIGAGLSGVCAAYHLKKTCPNKSVLVLEGRDRIGGKEINTLNSWFIGYLVCHPLKHSPIVVEN